MVTRTLTERDLRNKYTRIKDRGLQASQGFNALNNGDLAGNGGGKNPFLVVLGLITGTFNSYNAGSATSVQPEGWGSWLVDRLIALGYGISCGVTIFAAIYLLMTPLAGAGGILLIAWLGLFPMFALGLGRNIGWRKAFLIAFLFAAAYSALVLISTLLNVSLFPETITITRYVFCGFAAIATFVLNFCITTSKTSEAANNVFGWHAEEREQIKASEKTPQREKRLKLGSIDLDIKNTPRVPRILLNLLAIVGSIASGIAVGGLTYSSIVGAPSIGLKSLPQIFHFIPAGSGLTGFAVGIALITVIATAVISMKLCMELFEQGAYLFKKETRDEVIKRAGDYFGKLFNWQRYCAKQLLTAKKAERKKPGAKTAALEGEINTLESALNHNNPLGLQNALANQSLAFYKFKFSLKVMLTLAIVPLAMTGVVMTFKEMGSGLMPVLVNTVGTSAAYPLMVAICILATIAEVGFSVKAGILTVNKVFRNTVEEAKGNPQTSPPVMLAIGRSRIRDAALPPGGIPLPISPSGAAALRMMGGPPRGVVQQPNPAFGVTPSQATRAY
ncbi:MAG TPA: hypothetical protein VJB02_00615 [Coxiellaceae bacterium]|nr:hypothetical protein [Coxiellaceae bacterium]